MRLSRPDKSGLAMTEGGRKAKRNTEDGLPLSRE